MENTDSFYKWLRQQKPMSDVPLHEVMLSYFCAIIRPLSTSDLVAMRAYLKRTVDAGPEEEVGLELIEGELALRDLRQG